eukprot:323912_1
MPETNDHPFIGWIIFHFIFKANLHSSAVWWTIFIGSITPDLSMLLFYITMKIKGQSFEQIFDNDYYNNKFWSNTFNYSHSIPITLFLSIIFYIIYYAISSRNQNIYWNNTKSQNNFKKKLNINTVELQMRGSIMSSDMANMDINEISITYDEDEYDKNISNNLYITSMQTKALSDSKSRLIRDISNSTDSSDYNNGNNKRIHSNINCRNCIFDIQSICILLSYFFMSMCIHSICDFPLHNNDAHAQLVPFSNYIFHSPISYWDYNHYAYIVSPIISLFVICVSIWMYKYKKNDWIIQSLKICGKQCKIWLYIMIITLILNAIVDGISFVQAIYHCIKLLS